jgi:spore maturation protein B
VAAAVISSIVPLTVLGILLYGVLRGTNVYEAMADGIREGLRVCTGIFPAVLIMMTAVSMLRASGAVRVLADTMAPLMEPLGVPAECLPLALLRPFTGGGTMAVGSEIIAAAGPDSFTGRVAAVMLGSSETSFYVVAVYSAYLRMKNTRYALPAALCADLAAFLAAGWAVQLLMP